MPRSALVLLALLLCAGGAPACSDARGDARGAGPPPLHPDGPSETCATRSTADFGAAFADPRNLVVGPFALVGAGVPTSAAVVEEHGGQKFPVLVREGHVVTVRVPASARAAAALGYGPLPQGTLEHADGHATVTFAACGPGEDSGSQADGPVTFWSGFLLAREPACVPLDVWIDEEPEPRRVEIMLGRAC